MSPFTLLLVCMLAGSPGPAQWRWPVGPPAPAVVRGFVPPALPWGPGHRGVDLAARPGGPVYAAGAGRVSYAGRLAGRGVVAITHGTLRTTYLPVRASVRAGRVVATGARIGVVEAAPMHCQVPCLHWGLRNDTAYLDPLSLVRPRVRLLPLWPAPDPQGPGDGATAGAEHGHAVPPAARRHDRPPRMGLRYATSAGGGALTGMTLTLLLAFFWRQGRVRKQVRRRPPPGVIDLARERRLRRAR
ncbi:murein hydrolase activator EnvC family protein [Actinomadura macrotermitis]|uniref:M23ase beta-sheet core domain-containing protein n=1 Tax=Actinomadura macrotermitis TaxID=2585200 RepID=A0A7K0BP88_9ACTN|nr:M23 family metallopeptidase [Actinomadura macrotermitis]MQY03008.1 hypothetical protein [Actinomadura macrotermitis]